MSSGPGVQVRERPSLRYLIHTVTNMDITSTMGFNSQTDFKILSLVIGLNHG